MTGWVAPARYPLTVLHRAAPDGTRTLCGLPMNEDELWMPVECRDGDVVHPACAGAAEDVQEALL